VTFVVPPGEPHVVGWPHLRAVRDPGELIGFGVPLRLCGYGCAAKDGWFSVIEGDGVVRKPRTESFASACGDGLREAALKLQQEQNAGAQIGLGEWIGGLIGSLGECVDAGRSCCDASAALRGRWKGCEGAKKKAESEVARHVGYATSL
jgi:hypothetical protein